MLRLKRVLGRQSVADEAGIALLEVVLAVAVLSITLTSMVALSATVSQNTRTSRDAVVADRYAREGVEMLRAYRDGHTWSELRRIGLANAHSHPNVYEELPVWGTRWNPTCSPDRYYFMLPTGPEIPEDTHPYWAACGSHAQATTPGNLMYRMLNDLCHEPWLQEAFLDANVEANTSTGNLFYEGAKVTDRYWRILVVTLPELHEMRVRSVVCYQDGQAWRQVQVDGALTNWR